MTNGNPIDRGLMLDIAPELQKSRQMGFVTLNPSYVESERLMPTNNL